MLLLKWQEFVAAVLAASSIKIHSSAVRFAPAPAAPAAHGTGGCFGEVPVG